MARVLKEAAGLARTPSLQIVREQGVMLKKGRATIRATSLKIEVIPTKVQALMPTVSS